VVSIFLNRSYLDVPRAAQIERGSAFLEHRDLDLFFFCEPDGFGIAGIGVPGDADAGITR
jgi:hypothetical protein